MCTQGCYYMKIDGVWVCERCGCAKVIPPQRSTVEAGSDRKTATRL